MPKDKGSHRRSVDHPSRIAIQSRKDKFDSSTWWMVDLDFIMADPSQGATRLFRQCMRAYGWSEKRTRQVLVAYRQFLLLKAHKADWDATILHPSMQVGQMWRQHILDVNNYYHDCMLICGHVVGYDPESNFVGEDVIKKRRMATRDALLMTFDENEIDRSEEGVWHEVFHELGKDNFDCADSTDVTASTSVSESSQSSVDSQLNHDLTGEKKRTKSSSSSSSSQSRTVALRIQDESGDITNFRVRRSMRMEKLFFTFAQIKHVDREDLVFVYKNEIIKGNEFTADNLEMDDRAKLYVFYDPEE